MDNFDDFGLSQSVMTSLTHMNYEKPTPIQAQAIPHALSGRDIMGTAQTGTGKTAAFAIPLIEHLLAHKDSGQALVLTPTRELGKQIMDIMHQLLGPKSQINTAFIIGGEPYFKQMKQLKQNPRLIVGTPGRINDHLEQGTLKLDNAHFLVLDETDRMLDMGFSVQLERIFKFMPEQRQTLMFSATMPKEIKKMVNQYLDNPQYISVGEVNTVKQNIKQEVIRIEQPQKYDELKSQLENRQGSVIVFVKTKHGADKMAKNLRRDGFTSEALHGDLRQNRRDKVMINFRKQNFRVLIATDIAARGLDVPHIEHVVNFDLPQVAEDFIHRMGRTARAGADGEAISFVAGHDVSKWRAIERLIDPDKAANDRASQKEGKSNRFKNKKRSFGKRENFAGYEDDVKVEDKKPFNDKKKKPFAKKDGRRDDFKKDDLKKEGGEKKDYSAKRGDRFKSDKSKSDKFKGDKRDFRKERNDNEQRSFDKPKKHFGAKKDFKSDRDNASEGGKRDHFKKDGFKKDGFKSKQKFNDREDRPAFKGKGKPSGENRKSFGGKSDGGKSFGQKSQGGKPNGQKPNGQRSHAGKPAQNKNGKPAARQGAKSGNNNQTRKHFEGPKRRTKAA